MKRVSLKRVVRLITKVALAVMVILLVIVTLLWFFFPREQIGFLITKELSSKFNHDITMSKFSIGFYPDLELSHAICR